MFARIGIMRALNRNVDHAFDSSRKDWERRKLARDQSTKAGKYRGINPDFMKCPGCGQRFDMRDLDQILLHFHDAIEVSEGPEQPPPKGCNDTVAGPTGRAIIDAKFKAGLFRFAARQQQRLAAVRTGRS